MPTANDAANRGTCESGAAETLYATKLPHALTPHEVRFGRPAVDL
jgi:hypothetical protein